jgi:hypothetical protein
MSPIRAADPFYIKQEYQGAEFYIESSCGDDSFEETAFFAGSFNS